MPLQDLNQWRVKCVRAKNRILDAEVNEDETEKVKMAFTAQFGQNMLGCGVKSIMSKHDILAAYN